MDFNINSTLWVHIHYHQKALSNYSRVAIYLELFSKLSSKILLYLFISIFLAKAETHNDLYRALIIVIIFLFISLFEYIFID